MPKAMQCGKCKHRPKRSRSKGQKNITWCSAYPNGIPRELFIEEVIHNKVLEGQVGTYIYEPAERWIEYEKQYELMNKKYTYNNYIKEIKEKTVEVLYGEVLKNQDFLENWRTIVLKARIENGKVIYEEILINSEKNSVSFYPQKMLYFLVPEIRRLLESEKCYKENGWMELKIFPDKSYEYQFGISTNKIITDKKDGLSSKSENDII